MACILPYHQTPAFFRMARLLEIKGTKWEFLKASIKAGTSLSRETLVHKCVSDVAVLQFVCDMANRSAKFRVRSSVTTVTFSTVVLLEAIAYTRGKMSEAVLRILIQHVVRGIQSHDDFQTSALMITGQLASSVTFKKEACDSLLQFICKHAIEKAFSENALLVLVQICATQTLFEFPSKAFAHLIKSSQIAPTLTQLSASYDVSAFLRLTLLAGVEHCVKHENYLTALKALLACPAAKPHVATVIRNAVQMYTTLDKDAVSEKQALSAVLRSVEYSYPDEVDQGLRSAMESLSQESSDTATSSSASKQAIFAVASQAFRHPRHQLVSETSDTVFISLTHPNPDIRITAMSLLVSGGGSGDDHTGGDKGGKSKKTKGKGKKEQRRSSTEQSSPALPVESLSDIALALLERVRDDHLGVAKHAVTHLHTLAPLLHQHQCVDGAVLFETCESVLTRVLNAEDDLSSSAVKLCAKIFALLTTELLEIEGDMERRLAVLCLKHLLLMKKTDKLSAAARKVAARDWTTFGPLFVNLDHDQNNATSGKKSKGKKDKTTTDSGNRALVNNLARNLLAISRTADAGDSAATGALGPYYTLLEQASNAISGHILSLLTLTRFLSLLASDTKGGSAISNHAVTILLKLTAQHIHGVSSPARATAELSYEDDAPGSGLLYTQGWADIEGTSPSGLALIQSRVIVYVYLSLSHTLVSKPGSSASRSVMSSGVRNICASILASPRWFATLVPALQAFLQAHNHGHPLQFLSTFYLDDIPSSCGHSVLRRTRALQLTQSYLAGHQGSSTLDTAVCQHITIALLTTLCTTVKEVRQATLACLHALSPVDGVLGDIVSAVLGAEEEILGSPDYITQVLAGLLSDPALVPSNTSDSKGHKGKKGKKKGGESKGQGGSTLTPTQQRQAVTLLVTQALQLPSERGTAVALHTLRHVRHGEMILPLLKYLTAHVKAYHASQAASTPRRSTGSVDDGPLSWAQYALYNAVHHVVDDIEVASSNPAMDHFLGLFSLSCHAAASAATLNVISSDDQLKTTAGASGTTVAQPLALACIQVTTPTFYAALKEEHKVALLSTLFDALASSPAVVGEAVKALCTSLPSPAQHIGEILTQVAGQLRDAAPGAKASASSPTKRVRRTTAADDGASATSSQFRSLISRLTSIVEVVHLIIQPSLDIVKGLVRHLFTTLAVVREVGGALLESEDRSLDYVQLLLFQALEKITSFIVQWRQDKDESPVKNITSFLKDLEALYDTDALFTTLTTSPNPQTQNSALLLLTSTAALYPKKTVQHIVPALSAIGSLGWRQDDEYTYQSLTRAISHIVPMMMSLPESDREGLTPVALITVFVEALPGIPSLRRQRVCQALLQALGAEVVHYFVVALMGKVALNKTFIMSASEISASEEESGKSVTTETLMRSPAVTLAHEVLADFGGLDQMTGLGKLLEWVSDLPLDDATLLKVQRKAVKNSSGKNKGKGGAHPEILDWSLYALPHLKLIRLALLQFCLNHAESTEFLDEMVLTADDDGNEQSFTDSVEKVLKISRVATDAQVAARNEQNRKLDSYWTQVDSVVVQLLNAFTDLLSIPTFGSLVGNLIAFDEGMIRARGLSLLLSRVEREEKRETLRDQGEPLCDLVDPIRGLVINKKESPETVQLGLQCLSTLCIHFGTVQPNAFVEALAELSTILERSQHLAVRGACALALGHFCEQLGAKTLAHLQKFLPVVIDCLAIEDDHGLADGTPADQNLFLECVLRSCQALVSSVGAFTHPKIGALVRNLLESDLTRRGALDDSIRATLMTVAHEIPSQVAVPVATSLYKHALSQGEASLVHYLDFVNAICKRIDASRVKALYRTLAKFFLSAFDFRRLHASSVPAPDRIENLIVETFCSFVLKLSESLFKPLFVKIVEWYQVNPAVPADDPSTLPNPWRAYMFARVLDAVASRLKTLIVPYFGSIMTDLLRDLDDEHDAFNVRGEGVDDDEDGGGLFLSAPPTPGVEGKSGKKKRKRRRDNGFTLSDRRELCHNHTVYILSALTSCFTYDDESFVTPEIFEGATDPLVAQLARLEGDVVLFQQRVDEALIPCITSLAACLREESVWKPLNHKVLLQTRSEEAPARFAALRTLQSLFSKLGEEYLTLLPETIPFLAELLEDDNPMVERLAKEVANQLTDLSGENIQDMLQM
eukprot:TRINITY_DN3078_c0_g1_i2.p1 TRINITY_DN3078_c0_g1~~TRINITY_DN3078_c0_g1_i2.p1  ORF type:complete len:2172 (+),score=638.68 TRINITY_DN3078_c0_g1_i2:356-6871(+)